MDSTPAAQQDSAELPADVVQSPLYNPDLAPVPKARRVWSIYNFAALWISMAVCIPTYMLAGSLVASGMNWWQALLTIGLGNLIVLVPILLNAHPGTKYGVPFPVLARASFGTRGANIAAILRAIVACGWFGIQTFVGGEALKTFIETIWPSFANLGGGASILGLSLASALTFLIFWAVNIFIIYRGMNAIRIFENWAAPILAVLMLALVAWAMARAGGVGPLLGKDSSFHSLGEFWKVFVPSLTAMVGFWATLSLNIPDFTRFGRGQREQMWGQTLGLPTAMVAFSAMGVITTSASQAILSGVSLEALWDPVKLLGFLTSPLPPPGMAEPLILSSGVRILIALLAVFGIAVATISTNIAANVVSPANDFANLAPRRISFRTGGLITGIIGIAMAPWKLLATVGSYIFTWLVGYSALLGPIAGIMIADYWIVRRKELDVADLYRPNGRYAGVSWQAVTALVVAVAPNVPGFLKAAGAFSGEPTIWDALYPYAWFIGFAIAFCVYVATKSIGESSAAKGASAPTA